MLDRYWWQNRSFLYIGRIHPNKGIKFIISAWLINKQKHPNCPSLWISGGTPDEIESIRSVFAGSQLYEESEKSGKIVWWGYHKSETLSSLLLKAHVLIIHSEYEPGGRVIMESMATGVPIIATPQGFAWDMVKDWVNGFIVNFGDIALLASRMEHFIHQPLLRQSMGREAKLTAQKALESWSFGKRHLEIYNSVIARQTPHKQNNDKHLLIKNKKRLITYSHNLISTDIENKIIEGFLSKYFNSNDYEYVYLNNNSSSHAWRCRFGVSTYFVKQTYTRINLHPVWDSTRREPLSSSQSTRYTAETSFGKLQHTRNLLAQDDMNFLLLFEGYDDVNESDVDILRLFEMFKSFYYQDKPIAIVNFERENHVIRTSNEVYEDKLKTTLKFLSFDWCAHEKSSLVSSWNTLSTQGVIDSEFFSEWFSRNYKLIAVFIDFANSERDIALGWCHGSTHYDHLKKTNDNDYIFIDADHYHIGVFGEDVGSFIFNCLKHNSMEHVEDILNACVDSKIFSLNEIKLILSWAVFHTCRDILRLSTYRSLAKQEDLTHKLSNMIDLSLKKFNQL